MSLERATNDESGVHRIAERGLVLSGPASVQCLAEHAEHAIWQAKGMSVPIEIARRDVARVWLREDMAPLGWLGRVAYLWRLWRYC